MDPAELEEAIRSLKRIQEFDATSLAQRGRLGEELNFEIVVPSAQRLITLFKKIPAEMLNEFSSSMTNAIKQHSDAFYSELKQILEFSFSQDGSTVTRQNLINGIRDRYDQTFDALHPIISFALARTVDFGDLEEKGRAAVQAIHDRAEEIESELQQTQEEAKRILDDIRRTAAEQGVSQQALWFKGEADKHEKRVGRWMWITILAAASLIAYTAMFFFWYPPDSNSIAQTAQFISTKFLIFVVLAFLLFVAARTYSAHYHNTIVNRHRQNALLTFEALVDATKSDESQDIVLNHAASCIFSPQETGFTKQTSSQGGGLNISLMEMFMRRGLSGGTDVT